MAAQSYNMARDKALDQGTTVFVPGYTENINACEVLVKQTITNSLISHITIT